MHRLVSGLTAAVLAIGGLVVAPASAALAALDTSGAVIDDAACTATTLPANDDGSSGEVGLPFTLNFYGTEYSSLWVNNNGNVTLDGPLAAYTPFGLYATDRAIIAPFFADVDTRAAGSSPVRYSYGTTQFQGREAFCVNWVDVGYYNGHSDKLNSFQLLLVSRPDKGDGAFDIVFNYDKIQWETGDASGGSNGYGGTPARVGFASGDGVAGTATELPGSGLSRAFLDQNSGLKWSKLGSDVLGRYVFSVRGDGVVGDTYVALGDSYQSGEGAYDYEAGTDVVGTNMCHRSANAYPQRLVDRGAVRLDLDFVACSGAVMVDMLTDGPSTEGPPWDEDAQIDHLGDDTRLVTIGIVGNDLGFADTVTECVLRNVSRWGLPALWDTSCAGNMDESAEQRLERLTSGATGENLLGLYRLVRLKAPYARVVVVSYPRFFPEGGGGGFFGCSTIRDSDQRWMNSKIVRADAAIGAIAARAGFEYVNMADVLDGQEQCTAQPAMNGLLFEGVTPQPESFHPNALGHGLMADLIEAKLNTTVAPTFSITPGQTVTRSVTASGRNLAVNVAWPGSDVVTTLISPSGTTYTREAPLDAEHDNGPTFEYFEVADPEPGEWTVEMYGADVDPNGEPVTLLVADDPVPNAPPTADFTTSGVGATRVFDASASTDGDGEVAEYYWDFGDGTTATGVRVEHTYTTEGPFAPVLEVTDDDGARAYRQAATNVEVGSEPAAGGGTVYSGSSVQLTNAFTAAGDGADVVVDGDVQCNSSVVVEGDLVATGDVHLTNACHVDGDVHAGGSVVLDSTPSVGGSLDAVGDVRIQSTARIGGDLRAGGRVVATDGGALATLVERGVVGGTIEEGAAVPIPKATAPVAPAEPAAATSLTWGAWMNATATANAAPSWSQGLTSSPGCTMAPWGASVNGSSVTLTGNTVIDARSSTSGCSTATIQGMTLRLGGDVTLLVDGFAAPAGMTVTTTDGQPHTLRVIAGGAGASATGGAVGFSTGVTTTEGARLELHTPGAVSINGPASFGGRVVAGQFATSGAVTVGIAP